MCEGKFSTTNAIHLLKIELKENCRSRQRLNVARIYFFILIIGAEYLIWWPHTKGDKFPRQSL